MQKEDKEKSIVASIEAKKKEIDDLIQRNKELLLLF